MTNFLVSKFLKRSETLAEPARRQKYGQLSGVVGIVLNLLLCGGKLMAGAFTASISITADAFNNLSDAGAALISLVGFRLAGHRADENHPFGHGRIEYLAGFLMALLILVVGFELGKTSLKKIFVPGEVVLSALSVIILTVSICVKLWMASFNRTLGRRINSPALAAAAADSLSDAGATTAVLVGALAAHFFDLRVDGAVGLLVAVLILRAGWGVAKDTLNPLVGQAPDPDLIRQISADILCHPQIRGIHDLILHDYGPGRAIMSLHVEMAVDAVSPNVMDLHNAIDAIEREIQETYQIETSIHMDPIVISGAQVSQIRGRVADLVRGIDPALNIRNFCMTPGANLVFDVVVPPSVSLTDEQVADAVKQSVAAMEGGIYCAVVQINHI